MTKRGAVQFCSLWALFLVTVRASPIYPGYGDFAPLVIPGAYGAGPYPVLAGGAYFGAPVQHHAASGRYSAHETSGYGEKAIDYQKDSKYYYGGQYKGSCLEDGLYYKDDTAFVMCSNGYPHEQPCPPGTKTSGSPAYKPGYYYGYTDLCSVNLVDYGLGPEHYAPAGPPEDEKSSHYSRGGSSSNTKVSYSSAGYAGPHGGEKHLSKDVYSQQGSVGHHGHSGQQQQQHLHVEKHKVHGNHGAAYDKQVVKQGAVTSYDDERPGYPPNHAAAHYDVNSHTSYGGPGHVALSQQSVHKEKQQTIGYPSSPVHHQHHSEHTRTSQVAGQVHHGSEHHHSAGSAYPSAHGFDSYSNHGQYPTADRVVDKVQTSSTVYHGASGGAAHHGSVETYQNSGSQGGYNQQFGEYGYPQLGSGHPANRPLPYDYRGY